MLINIIFIDDQNQYLMAHLRYFEIRFLKKKTENMIDYFEIINIIIMFIYLFRKKLKRKQGVKNLVKNL